MKRFFMNCKAVVASIAMAAVVSSSMVSCSQEFDDTAIWDEINNLKKEIALLKEMVETELFALNELVNGLVTVKDVKADKDGNKVVTLSDGTKITIYPKADDVPSNIITTITEDGVMYWAYYDSLGNAQVVVVDGKKVRVADVVPQTQIVDNTIQVSFDGGNTWMTTGYTESESVADSVFSDIEVVYSDWQTDSEGNPLPLYCIFTMNDGSTIKIGMQNSRIVLPYDSIFVAYGSSTPFTIEIQDAADFMITTPKGWECDAHLDTKNELIYIDFLAPTQEAITSGNAVSEGVVKLMVVFNNGSSSIASIKVTCNPAVAHFTLKGVHIEVGYGTRYMYCGLTPSSSYKAKTVATWCETVISGTAVEFVTKLDFTEKTSRYVKYQELRSKGVEAGTEYVFWYIAPRENEDGPYVLESEVFTETYTHSSVNFEVNSTSFFDADITFTTESSNNYKLGFCPAEEFDAAALAEYYTENPADLNATHTQGEPYTGSFVKLFNNGAPLQYNTEYKAYYIAENSKNVYLTDHVVSWTFTTKDFTTGGDIEVVVVGEPIVEYESIKMTLNSKTNNHIAMFYNAMPSNQATAYPDDESIIEMLTSEDALSQISSEAIVAHYKDATPGTKLTFFAVAVDTEGKFGKPFKQEFTTKEFEYNDLTVTAELVSYKIDDTQIKLTCEGAASYRYIVTPTEDKLWTEQLKKDAVKAGEHMIMYPNNSEVCNTTNENYALVDGHILLNGLEASIEYVLVVMAVDADGIVSKPTTLYFTPIANIGTVVTRDQAQWAETKPTVSILYVEDNPHLFLSFSWSCLPAPHTKVYTAALFPNNFINEELGTNIDTLEKLIAHIISNCDTGGMSEPGKSFEWQESGIYLREWVEWEDTNGDNYLEEVYHSEERDAPYIFYPYGTADMTFIYTTWVGEDGNFCEPFAVDPMTGEEVDLWVAM